MTSGEGANRRPLEDVLAEARSEIARAAEANERILDVVNETRDVIFALRDHIDHLGGQSRANGSTSDYGIFLRRNGEGTADVITNGRKRQSGVLPDVDIDSLRPGQEVLLNEALEIVRALGYERTGEVATLEEVLSDRRAVVRSHSDDRQVVRLAASLDGVRLRTGDWLLIESRSGWAYERLPRSDIDDLLLEKVPDVEYESIGGLDEQIRLVREAVEFPYTHADAYNSLGVQPTKGVFLCGPPGCGKTMIAKALANSMSRRSTSALFLNIKGPELLNKYVGETERQVRTIFARARGHAQEGTTVIMFFDEMDSFFRTRGTGLSSGSENTVTAQLLAEIDGVEPLMNVFVIGASNREDMIDPAFLRPGRLDLRIRIDRPDARAAREILGKRITADLPIHADDLRAYQGDAQLAVKNMIQRTVSQMYAKNRSTEICEVTYADGKKEAVHFDQFSSGAVLHKVVDRAKVAMIARLAKGGASGLKVQDFLNSARSETRAIEDLIAAANLDDWARISGKKGDQIVYVRTLAKRGSGFASRSIDPWAGNYG